MKTSLLFGKNTVDLELPESVSLLEMKTAEAIQDPTVAVNEALNNPIESPPLEDLAKGKRNACIVISDITRPVPNQVILPPILRTLQENGISREKITILIANGMHRPNLGRELESMVLMEDLVSRSRADLSDEEKALLDALAQYGDLKTILLEFKFVLYKWRIMRFLRAISDPRINMNRQTLPEFVAWASDNPGSNPAMPTMLRHIQKVF